MIIKIIIIALLILGMFHVTVEFYGRVIKRYNLCVVTNIIAILLFLYYFC